MIYKNGTERGEVIAYFKSHVIAETDECIIWPYSLAGKYPYIRIKYKPYYVCQLICEMRNGPKPGPEYEACHGPCKNELCINYRHLYWGTHSQNMNDKIRDGTNRNGNGWNNKTEIVGKDLF